MCWGWDRKISARVTDVLWWLYVCLTCKIPISLNGDGISGSAGSLWEICIDFLIQDKYTFRVPSHIQCTCYFAKVWAAAGGTAFCSHDSPCAVTASPCCLLRHFFPRALPDAVLIFHTVGLPSITVLGRLFHSLVDITMGSFTPDVHPKFYFP